MKSQLHQWRNSLAALSKLSLPLTDPWLSAGGPSSTSKRLEEESGLQNKASLSATVCAAAR